MGDLTISLFGRMEVRYDQRTIPGIDGLKVQELFCYILLFRSRPHAREVLAELLWGEQVTGDPKKYLRKTLWQLQTALAPLTDALGVPLVHTDGDWIQYNSDIDCWLDVDVFERAFGRCEAMRGDETTPKDAAVLRQAVDLYIGDLLDGWYQNWSLYERERYQFMYLAMLDKLINYHEVHHEYETGIRYGIQLLRCEPTHERTHRRIMRLYNSMGNRAAALRQYQQCTMALQKELDASPHQRTERLYEQIRSGSLSDVALRVDTLQADDLTVHDLYQRLKQMEETLANTQRQVADSIQALESLLHKSP